MLLTTFNDMPGVIGRFGITLGENEINIAGMQVGRQTVGGESLMVLQVDSSVPDHVLQQLEK